MPPTTDVVGMAFITKPKQKRGWVVRWYEHTSRGRRARSRYFLDETAAHALKTELDAEEQARKVLAGPGIPGWGHTPAAPAEDDAYSVETYLAGIINGNRDLRETTRALHRRNLRVHIAGTSVGRADVRYVTPQELSAWWAGLTCGRGALGNVAELLRMTFRRAVRDDLRPGNPLERTDIRKPGRNGARQVRPLAVEEVERLADAAATPRDRMEILLMGYAGLRAGEVGGLRPEDVDWQRGRLHLRQQVVRLHGELLVAELKTAAARRVVAIPPSVVAELRSYADANPGPHLLMGHSGGLRDAIRINASVQKAARRAGLKTHAHALRHTAVSLWIADGASPVDVQHAVGHANISTTLSQYAHLFEYGGEALAASMERRIAAHRNAS